MQMVTVLLKRMLLLAVACTLIPTVASAHRLNETYVYFNVTDDKLSGRIEATFKDLDKEIGLDTDGNGTVEDAEFSAQQDRVYEFLTKRLVIRDGNTFVPIERGPIESFDAGIANFALIGFELPSITSVPETISMTFEPLSGAGPGQLAMAIIESNTRVGLEGNEAYVSLTFDGSKELKTLSLVGEPWSRVIVQFIEHGIWHIWLGFDHVIFLMTLLLPAAMAAVGSRWAPLDDFGAGLWNVAKIVTVFTISHSITLTLAAFGIMQLPVGFVEAVIALSIIAVAIMNLFPQVHKHMLWIVFGFGLFHGFGFANVLAPLALDPTRRVAGIASFNIGVEIGQLAIVLIAFPVIWMMRRWSLYPPLAFRLGTAAIVLLASIWLAERTTDFNWDTRATIKAITGIVV